MKIELDIHARITPQEELVRNDGGIQAVPPGQVIMTLADGTAFALSRPRFEALAPNAHLDSESMTYLESEGDDPEPPPSEQQPFDPQAGQEMPVPQPPAAPHIDEEQVVEILKSGTVDEVAEWVGNDMDRARVALDHEKGKKSPRVTLIEQLESVLDVD